MELLLEIKNLRCDDLSSPINGIDLTLERGENIVMFGPENSGIELLLKIILGFRRNYTGDVIFKGKLLRDFDYYEFHSQKKEIGYLHSDYGLISNMSIEENISLPLRYHSKYSEAEVKGIANSLISAMNLEYCKKFRPIELTTSEILKTAYARAIALDPDILIIEHAFGAQSILNIKAFTQDLIKRSANREKSIIFITFNPEKFVAYADTYIMFFDGRAVFRGDRNSYETSDNPYLVQYKTASEDGPMSLL